MNAPLLRLENVRIDQGERPVFAGLSLETSGDRVGLSAGASVLLDVLEGTAQLVSGHFEVAGQALDRARLAGTVHVARPWSNAFRGLRFEQALVASLILAGQSRSLARQRVEEQLDALGLTSLAKRRLGPRPCAEHYIGGLVESLLLDPPVVAVQWPIGAIDPEGWVRYGSVLARALPRRRWLVGIPQSTELPVELAWFRTLDEVVWISSRGSGMVCAPDPKQACLLVELAEPADALVADLREAEISVQVLSPNSSRLLLVLPREPGGHPRTELLVDRCARFGLTLLHLEPLDGLA